MALNDGKEKNDFEQFGQIKLDHLLEECMWKYENWIPNLLFL